jgi:hypothetical protein
VERHQVAARAAALVDQQVRGLRAVRHNRVQHLAVARVVSQVELAPALPVRKRAHVARVVLVVPAQVAGRCVPACLHA